jgi:NTE family protein
MGRYFLQRMTELLAAKNVTTFADLLRTPSTDDLRYRYKVQIIASDLTGRCLLVLPRDAEKLGLDDPDALDVAQAAHMSMSIPIFFEPVRFRNPKTRQEHIVVDGGILSNFPVWLFDSDGPPEWPTFGLKLVEANPEQDTLADTLPPGPITGIVAYIKSLVSTMIEAHDRLYLEQDQFVRTITIPTQGVGSTDFDLTPNQEQQLFDAGRSAAETFLQSWDAGGGFPAYVRAYREAPPQTRRERAIEEMRSAGSSV